MLCKSHLKVFRHLLMTLLEKVLLKFYHIIDVSILSSPSVTFHPPTRSTLLTKGEMNISK